MVGVAPNFTIVYKAHHLPYTTLAHRFTGMFYTWESLLFWGHPQPTASFNPLIHVLQLYQPKHHCLPTKQRQLGISLATMPVLQVFMLCVLGCCGKWVDFQSLAKAYWAECSVFHQRLHAGWPKLCIVFQTYFNHQETKLLRLYVHLLFLDKHLMFQLMVQLDGSNWQQHYLWQLE